MGALAPQDRKKLVASLVDVTDLRALEQHVSQLQRLGSLGRLAGGVAHDFSNLLTVIGGHAELLRGRVAASSTSIRDIQAIEETTERAMAITRELLTFGRDDGRPPEPMEVDLCIERLRGLLQRLMRRDVSLRFVPGAAGSLIRMVPSQFEQVLMNLVLNARDAMPGGGEVRIASSVKRDAVEGESWLRIAVTDTGSGMDEATVERLFEPFFTTKKWGAGTGLGLATVQRVVDSAAGRIEVQSALGKGTRFDVWIPIWQPPQSPCSPPSSSSKSAPR